MAVSMSEVNERVSFRDVRIDAGFRTQKELAQAAAVVESTVWSAEKGRTISYRSARVLLNALNKKGGTQYKIPDLDWSVSES